MLRDSFVQSSEPLHQKILHPETSLSHLCPSPIRTNELHWIDSVKIYYDSNVFLSLQGAHTVTNTHTHTKSASIELAHNFLVHLHGLMQLSKIALRVGHLLALGFLTISVVCVDISRHSSDKSTSPNPEKYRLEAMLMGKSHETHQALNYLFFY